MHGEQKAREPRCAWYAQDVDRVCTELHTSIHGLSEKEAALRLKTYGANVLPDANIDSPVVLFLKQFQSPLIYILFVASGIVFLLGERMDAYIVLFVLLANAGIGFIQEGRAQNTLAALKHFTQTDAVVLRGGREVMVADTELVVGDIIVLREGDKISADARLVEAVHLYVDESALTGESLPVMKNTEVMSHSAVPVADQSNMVFKGTFALTGSARAVVVATGVHTVIGTISEKIISIDSDAPLKKDIAVLSRIVSITVLVLSAFIFLLGLSFGNSVRDMFFTSVAVAVSLIPEGLPIVITLVLATGVYRMAKQNALVKKLQAVEALGQATVIAVDKTGTITKNELMVERVFVGDSLFEVYGNGYEPKGEVGLGGDIIDPANHPELLYMGKIATFGAQAHISFVEEGKMWKVAGDPTEAALRVFGEKVGFNKDDLEREEPLVMDIPFDARTKFHTTLHRVQGALFLSALGAPETILDLATTYWKNGKVHVLSAKEKKRLEEKTHELSLQGLRVIACAVHTNAPHAVTADSVPELTFVGFFAMRDVLREYVRDSIEKAYENGIRVVMITGDHRVTGEALAREAGIFRNGDRVMVGAEIEAMTAKELSHHIGQVSVFARVTPEHKLKIIEAYKVRGDIIAMTGDGVNDALSLVAADLGIAMGRIGTEVTKEAADIVLLDDNFKSIIAALEEGRNIYASIKKVITYLFSTGIGELFVVVGALLLMMPLPLQASQILWLNLVTDGFLVVAMALEPREVLMGKKRQTRNTFFVNKRSLARMVLMGCVMMVGTLYVFGIHDDMTKASTMALTVLAIFQWFNAWNCRSETSSIFSRHIFSNLYLIGAMIVVVGLQLAAVYVPFMQDILHTTPLTFMDWVLVVSVAVSIIVVEEVRKIIVRYHSGNRLQ